MFALHHALATALSCLALAGANAAQTSSLWGKNGELYDRTRLPDFSYAGYAAGEADIPNLRPTMNIQDHGAVGDGKTDDTTAILQAVRSAKDGDVIYFPPGRYILKQKLIIAKRVSLKGAGSDQVSFVFPKSLGDIYGGYKQTPTGNTYSSNNGFIQYAGDKPHGSKTLIGSITRPAARGTNVIKVSSVRGLKTGQWVSVTMGSPRTAKDFLEMNLNVDRGCADRLCRNDALAFTFQSRIAEIVDANTIELERPLPYDLIMDYSPLSLYVFKPKLANIGVEGFTFEFQSTQYIGHYYEKGWNGIQFNSVSNSWIKDIVFINADIGINIFTSFFITVQSITHQSTRERLSSGGQSGHHGINLKQTSDCLVQFFEIDTRMVHDLTVDKFARGSVFSQGSGQDLNMDHHKAQNYGSLWVQLNSGSGARAYASGGASGRGPAAGSLTTFWNLQAADPQSLGLKSDFGPYLNFIAVHKGTVWPRTSKWTVTWLLEDMLPSDITPVNIFQAMRQKRLSTDNLVSDLLGGKGTGGMPLISL